MDGHGKSILVVDDNTDVRRVISILLMSAGYAVSEVCTWTEAADELKRRRYDVIVADFRTAHMDRNDSWKLCRDLCPLTPVIALSSRCGPSIHDDPFAGTKDWVFACFSKPIDARLLLYAVRNATITSDHAQHETCEPGDGLALYWNSAGRDHAGPDHPQ